MRELVRRFCFAAIIGPVACLILPTPNCLVIARGQPAAPNSTAENLLRSFLQNYDEVLAGGHDRTTRYFAAFVDLNGDGAPEAVVYLSGGGWCGSGGCTMLILARTDSTFRVVTKITITRPPIRVLTSTSRGWHNIAVWVQGGGIRPGYEAELRFDGKAYPSNPSTPPARRMAERAAGQVVIPSSQEGTPLYR